MSKLVTLLLLFFALVCGAYEIPKGVIGIGELEKAQQMSKASGKPVVLVVAIKTQPET
jgi:hypothetical protein